jgi:hypothetical protein
LLYDGPNTRQIESKGWTDPKRQHRCHSAALASVAKADMWAVIFEDGARGDFEDRRSHRAADHVDGGGHAL